MTMASPSPAYYEAAMKRALELATKGPKTGPNPQVGRVLLDSSHTIVAEGWHEGAGTPTRGNHGAYESHERWCVT